MVYAFQLFYARRARLIPDGMEPFGERFPKRFIEGSELLFGRRGQENCGNHRAISESQFFQNHIQGLGTFLVCLGQCRAGIDEIDTIFQVF